MADKHPTPVLVHSEEKVQSLERISLDKPPFDETGLQELLRKSPEILPISQLGPHSELYEPLISIGRESNLGGGCYLDNLFISPYGYLTLVETKLWKNPQARREVVGQIIEYAKQLSNWTYDELNKTCMHYLKTYEQKDMNLLEWVKHQSDEDIEDRIFIDTINKSLSLGEFKLLIVGEGIRESAIEMTEYLHNTPHLRFNLALIELACYTMSDDGKYPYMVVPRIVAKTAEVERAVVTINIAEGVNELVEVTVTTQTESAKSGQRSSFLEESEFFAALGQSIGEDSANQIREFVDELEELGLVKQYMLTSLSLRLRNPRNPEDSLLMTIVNVSVDGKLGRGGALEKRMKRWGLASVLVDEFVGNMHKIHHGFVREKTERGEYKWPTVKFNQVADKLPDIKEAVRWLLEQIHLEVDREEQ